MADPRWSKFWQNLAWFGATLVILIILLRVWASPAVLVALWLVGLGWGGWLAYQLSQLLLGVDQELVISEERSQVYLEQARAYKAKIEHVIESTQGSARQLRLQQLAPQIESWVDAIEALAARLSNLRQDELIRRDLEAVPQAIENLKQRLAAETDPELRRQLERTLANRQKQLATLETLQNSIKRAEIQVESTLSQLGTIYSQLLTGQSTDYVADYDRLSLDVEEEVRLLQDHLDALREVKLDRDEEF